MVGGAWCVRLKSANTLETAALMGCGCWACRASRSSTSGSHEGTSYGASATRAARPSTPPCLCASGAPPFLRFLRMLSAHARRRLWGRGERDGSGEGARAYGRFARAAPACVWPVEAHVARNDRHGRLPHLELRVHEQLEEQRLDRLLRRRLQRRRRELAEVDQVLERREQAAAQVPRGRGGEVLEQREERDEEPRLEEGELREQHGARAAGVREVGVVDARGGGERGAQQLLAVWQKRLRPAVP